MEGEYGIFNVALWRLLHVPPVDGGMSLSDFYDLLEARAHRAFNGREAARVVGRVAEWTQTCRGCGAVCSHAAASCWDCRRSLGPPPRPRSFEK